MIIHFSKEQAILIYGEFSKRLKEIDKIEKAEGNPISQTTLNQHKKMFSGILETIVDAYPEIKQLDNFL